MFHTLILTFYLLSYVTYSKLLMLHYTPTDYEHLVSLMANLSNLVIAPMILYLMCKYVPLITEPNVLHHFLSQLYLKKMVTVLVYDYKNTHFKIL